MKNNIIRFIFWMALAWLWYNICFHFIELSKLSTMKQAFIWMNHEKKIMGDKEIYYYCIQQLKNEVGYSGINNWCIIKITDRDITNIVRRQISRNFP